MASSSLLRLPPWLATFAGTRWRNRRSALHRLSGITPGLSDARTCSRYIISPALYVSIGSE